jgi:hypothetical protein
MSPLLIGPLLELGRSIIGRLIPDPAEAAKAELELLKMTQDGDLKVVLAQLEVNAKEAVHPSIFVAGWRPAFGWCGAVGFLYATIGQPLIAWLAQIKGWPMPPSLNIDLLWVVVTGLLGLGTLRSVEKVKGKA